MVFVWFQLNVAVELSIDTFVDKAWLGIPSRWLKGVVATTTGIQVKRDPTIHVYSSVSSMSPKGRLSPIFWGPCLESTKQPECSAPVDTVLPRNLFLRDDTVLIGDFGLR